MTTSPPRASDCLIVALDVDRIDDVQRLVPRLAPFAGWFKIGSVLFTREGPAACAVVKQSGARLFLDLKFHDIPNTVAGAVRNAVALGADMLTLHASGGPSMLRAARAAADEVGGRECILVAVTVLTHLDQNELNATFGAARSVEDTVLAFAGMARDAGMNGVVASAHELPAIRRALGSELVVVTPGIRLPDAKADDQKRVVTPGQAIRDGATFLVVGRPIIAAPDPAAAARTVAERIEGAHTGK